MASTTTQRRKGGAPKSLDGVVQVSNVVKQQQDISVPVASVASVATVKRNKCGTGPFDENWLNVDCCGLFCAGITYCLHAYGVYAVCAVLLPPWMSTMDENGVRSMSLAGHFHRLAFTLVAVLAVASHFKAMTTDPGAVPPDASPLEDIKTDIEATRQGENGEADAQPKRKGRRICRRCNTFKPARAHHCSVCRRCIIKMDHHCPWVNNCVGIGNHKYFLLFVFYTCLSCVYSFTLVIVRFFSCMSHHGHVRHHHLTCLDRPTQLVQILGLVVEAILFGLFTSCMMIDQAGVVTSKMTHIDRLKGGDDASSGTSLAGVLEVFGSSKRGIDGTRFRPDWLSPFAKICFPTSLHDEIMGFCRPCLGGGNKAPVESSHASGTSIRPGSSQMVRSVAEIV